jgi:formylglycine-generating enzyme
MRARTRRLCALAGVLGGCAGALAADYVRLPAARFDSVLPQDVKPVAVSIAPFEMRVTPVTVDEYLRFVQIHAAWQRDRVPAVFADRRYLAGWPSPLNPGTAQPRAAPVTEVSWFAAQTFCASEGARLPSWLEWEYAAAADATRADARDDAQWRARILAWYERPSASALPDVGGAPNVYGVRDLHGLVWEWVDDFNALFIAGDSRTQGDPDRVKFCGAGAISIVGRDNYAVLMRVALLSSLNAADTTTNLGFRCARALKEGSR